MENRQRNRARRRLSIFIAGLPENPSLSSLLICKGAAQAQSAWLVCQVNTDNPSQGTEKHRLPTFTAWQSLRVSAPRSLEQSTLTNRLRHKHYKAKLKLKHNFDFFFLWTSHENWVPWILHICLFKYSEFSVSWLQLQLAKQPEQQYML